MSMPRPDSAARSAGEKAPASPLKRSPRATRLGSATACYSTASTDERKDNTAFTFADAFVDALTKQVAVQVVEELFVLLGIG